MGASAGGADRMASFSGTYRKVPADARQRYGSEYPYPSAYQCGSLRSAQKTKNPSSALRSADNDHASLPPGSASVPPTIRNHAFPSYDLLKSAPPLPQHQQIHYHVYHGPVNNKYGQDDSGAGAITVDHSSFTGNSGNTFSNLNNKCLHQQAYRSESTTNDDPKVPAKPPDIAHKIHLRPPDASYYSHTALLEALVEQIEDDAVQSAPNPFYGQDDSEDNAPVTRFPSRSYPSFYSQNPSIHYNNDLSFTNAIHFDAIWQDQAASKTQSHTPTTTMNAHYKMNAKRPLPSSQHHSHGSLPPQEQLGTSSRIYHTSSYHQPEQFSPNPRSAQPLRTQTASVSWKAEGLKPTHSETRAARIGSMSSVAEEHELQPHLTSSDDLDLEAYAIRDNSESGYGCLAFLYMLFRRESLVRSRRIRTITSSRRPTA